MRTIGFSATTRVRTFPGSSIALQVSHQQAGDNTDDQWRKPDLVQSESHPLAPTLRPPRVRAEGVDGTDRARPLIETFSVLTVQLIRQLGENIVERRRKCAGDADASLELLRRMERAGCSDVLGNVHRLRYGGLAGLQRRRRGISLVHPGRFLGLANAEAQSPANAGAPFLAASPPLTLLLHKGPEDQISMYLLREGVEDVECRAL